MHYNNVDVDYYVLNVLMTINYPAQVWIFLSSIVLFRVYVVRELNILAIYFFLLLLIC